MPAFSKPTFANSVRSLLLPWCDVAPSSLPCLCLVYVQYIPAAPFSVPQCKKYSHTPIPPFSRFPDVSRNFGGAPTEVLFPSLPPSSSQCVCEREERIFIFPSSSYFSSLHVIVQLCCVEEEESPSVRPSAVTAASPPPLLLPPSCGGATA